MDYMKLDDGSEIDKEFFEERLNELKRESWVLRDISQLGTDHVNCELTFETISKSKSHYFYESDKGSVVSAKAFGKYLKK